MPGDLRFQDGIVLQQGRQHGLMMGIPEARRTFDVGQQENGHAFCGSLFTGSCKGLCTAERINLYLFVECGRLLAGSYS